MSNISTEPPEFAYVRQRYSVNDARMLIQMNKSHQKNGAFGISPFNLIAFWFGNGPAPKGFAKVSAPSLPPLRLSRVMALYHHAKSGDEHTHNIAALYANVILWATMFPEECERNYSVDEVFCFDPDYVEEWLEENSAISTKPYAAAFDLRAADCVRVAYNLL